PCGAYRLAAGLGGRVGRLERGVVVVADGPGDRELAGGRQGDAPDVGGAVADDAVDDAARLLVLVAGAHQRARRPGVGRDRGHARLADRGAGGEPVEDLGDGRVPMDRAAVLRSEERRVGKGWSGRGW